MRRISKYAYSKSNALLCILLTVLMILYASLIMGSQSKCVSFRNKKLILVNRYPFVPAIADLIENYFENLLVSKK